MSQLKNIYKEQVDETLFAISKEIYRAKAKHPGDFVSFHHAYAVALEEVDELWDLIKSQKPNKQDIREEAIQAAAMLVRLVVELTGEVNSVRPKSPKKKK